MEWFIICRLNICEYIRHLQKCVVMVLDKKCYNSVNKM
ncbi:UNVERIFIED_CONTAM: hypothetical protein GTU68_065352 [Idotea baltica]|nr:hypothetical protein [Idotea baltica]